jgi:uncharacterized protein YbjT (DUF2867 family)
MVGIEKMFLLCPVHPRQVELEANAIDAARAADIERIVKLSVINASIGSAVPLERWHAEAERRIEASGVPYTFLRPNMFMQELLRQADSIRARGEFFLPLGGARVSLTDVRDIAAVAATVLTQPAHAGNTYTVTGPQFLSFDDVAAALSSALGRPVRYVPVPMDVFKSAFTSSGAPQWLADVVGDLYASIAAGNNATVTGEVARVTGKPARTFAAFAREHAGMLRE